MVETLDSLGAQDQQQLSALLIDSIEHGASVGWVNPVDAASVIAYWQMIASDLAEGRRSLLVIREDGKIIASMQLEYAGKPNGLHRAEIQKVLVHSAQRRQGLGKRLMETAETLARHRGRTLLVLDTESASAGQRLYASMGYVNAGEVPNFAIGTNGGWTPTTYMYKLLSAHAT